jgi:hypothetical protein
MQVVPPGHADVGVAEDALDDLVVSLSRPRRRVISMGAQSMSDLGSPKISPSRNAVKSAVAATQRQHFWYQ